MSNTQGPYSANLWNSLFVPGVFITIIFSYAGAQEASIVGDIPNQLKSINETVQLNCVVNRASSVKVHWKQLFNGQPFEISSEDKILARNPVIGNYPNNKTKYEIDIIFDASFTTYTYRLTINYLAAIDAGLYKCELISSGQLQPTDSKNTTVSIRGVVQGPQIVYEIGDVTGTLNGSATLSCLVAYKGNNAVTWIRLKDNRELSSDEVIVITNPIVSGQRKFTINHNSESSGERYDITVHRLTVDDQGQYKCEVRSSQTTVQKTGTLSVGVSPTISPSGPENVTLQIGGNVDLTCTPNGSPQPTIIWQREDFKNLPNGQQSYKGNTISITSIKKEQRGLYKCQASNGIYPDDSWVFRVMVNFSPNVRALTTNVSQAVGYTAYMDCFLEGHPDVTPKWYKMETNSRREIISNQEHDIQHTVFDGKNGQISSSRFSLRISNVQPSDFGLYQCEGTSPGGLSSATIPLTESSTCVGESCPVTIRPGPSTDKSRETTTCKGDNCTGGSSSLRLGCLLLVLTLFLSIRSMS